jgi:hypothetical protein
MTIIKNKLLTRVQLEKKNDSSEYSIQTNSPKTNLNPQSGPKSTTFVMLL